MICVHFYDCIFEETLTLGLCFWIGLGCCGCDLGLGYLFKVWGLI